MARPGWPCRDELHLPCRPHPRQYGNGRGIQALFVATGVRRENTRIMEVNPVSPLVFCSMHRNTGMLEQIVFTVPEASEQNQPDAR